MTTADETVKRIEAELAAAEKVVDGLARQLYEAQCNASGVHPGDIVRGTTPGDDIVLRVTKVSMFNGTDKPWVTGIQRKKDGTFGDRSRTLYRDWDHVAADAL